MKNVCFMGGQEAGAVGLRTCLRYSKVLAVVPYSEHVIEVADKAKIPLYSSWKDKGFMEKAITADWVISVHGKEIIKPPLLSNKCVNLHPYLYAYPGRDPVGRAIRDRREIGSVGMHYMTDKVDKGEVLVEFYKRVKLGSREKVYAQLYPVYASLLRSLLTWNIDKYKNFDDVPINDLNSTAS